MMSAEESRRILVVEDDDAIREMLSRALTRTGFTVDVASGVGEAIVSLDDGALHHDLIVLDLDLPDQHGSAVFRALRTRHRAIPVIIISGTADIEDAIHAFRLGAADFVRKPFMPNTLLSVIERVLFESPSPPRGVSVTSSACTCEVDRSVSSLLSRRELEVALAITEVHDTGKLARDLHISPHTVRNHLKSIYQKLNIHSRAELVRVLMGARRASALPGEVIPMPSSRGG